MNVSVVERHKRCMGMSPSSPDSLQLGRGWEEGPVVEDEMPSALFPRFGLVDSEGVGGNVHPDISSDDAFVANKRSVDDDEVSFFKDAVQQPDAIRSLEMEVMALKLRLAEACTQDGVHTNEVRTLAVEKCDLSKKIDAITEERDAMRTRISEYHKVLGHLRRNAKDCSTERAGLRVAVEAAQGECERLRIGMKRTRAENDKLRKENEEMEDMVTLLRDNAESLTRERDEWKAKWEEATATAARDSSNGAVADDASSVCSSRFSMTLIEGGRRGSRRSSLLGSGRAQASSLVSGLCRAADTAAGRQQQQRRRRSVGWSDEAEEALQACEVDDNCDNNPCRQLALIHLRNCKVEAQREESLRRRRDMLGCSEGGNAANCDVHDRIPQVPALSVGKAAVSTDIEEGEAGTGRGAGGEEKERDLLDARCVRSLLDGSGADNRSDNNSDGTMPAQSGTQPPPRPSDKEDDLTGAAQQQSSEAKEEDTISVSVVDCEGWEARRDHRKEEERQELEADSSMGRRDSIADEGKDDDDDEGKDDNRNGDSQLRGGGYGLVLLHKDSIRASDADNWHRGFESDPSDRGNDNDNDADATGGDAASVASKAAALPNGVAVDCEGWERRAHEGDDDDIPLAKPEEQHRRGGAWGLFAKRAGPGREHQSAWEMSPEEKDASPRLLPRGSRPSFSAIEIQWPAPAIRIRSGNVALVGAVRQKVGR